MNERILVVDDEPKIVKLARDYLERSGYVVLTAGDGRSALTIARSEKPDMVVLDLNLPGMDGMEVCRTLRRESDVPIIMLTARREETDRILGLEMGADDYVVKPFSPQELVSRVRAVLRRTAQPAKRDEAAPSQRALRFADLTVDPTTRLATVRGEEIVLTAKEFDLLWFLAGHPRQVFNRDQLLDNVWGETQYIDPSTVTVHVRRLREKLEADPSTPRHILTVWGVGYKFEP
ncbi:MAG: response regulator transcription factor [Caldilineaceae bacterium]|nr:response regulator transcription factor [Caldilineaceae bacterium]